MTIFFFLQNLALGAGLAMDAVATSMTDGLKEPGMKKRKWVLIAALFAFFQALMPIVGYFAGHALLDYIGAYLPWIALVLLAFLGGKMIFDGVKDLRQSAKNAPPVSAETAVTANVSTEKENLTESKTAETLASAEKCASAVGGNKISFGALIVQAIATSIDALSVGLSISDYTVGQAMIAAGIIAAVTFGLCMPAVYIGRRFGDKLGGKAVILGGIILVAIGIEICVRQFL